MTTRKVFNILFLVIGFATLLEYTFVSGMFTGPLMMLLIGLLGLVNLIWDVVDRHWSTALLYLLATLALEMGYCKLMF